MQREILCDTWLWLKGGREGDQHGLFEFGCHGRVLFSSNSCHCDALEEPYYSIPPCSSSATVVPQRRQFFEPEVLTCFPHPGVQTLSAAVALLAWGQLAGAMEDCDDLSGLETNGIGRQEEIQVSDSEHGDTLWQVGM